MGTCTCLLSTRSFHCLPELNCLACAQILKPPISTMASNPQHEDDTMPEETQGYKLSQPKQSLAEYQQMDAGDESLQRYKESLGLGGGKDISDPNDPRVCIIQSLTLDLSAPGSEATLKDKPFKIKEGSKFTMSAKF